MAERFTGMYPHCQKYGITSETLECDSPILPEVQYITNALVIELNAIRSSKNCSWQRFHGWIQALFGERYPHTTEAPSTSSLRAAVVKLEGKKKLLKKRKDTSQLDDFICQEFLLPGRRHKRGSIAPDFDVNPDAEVDRQVNIQLAKELAEKSQELSTVNEKYSKLRKQHEASTAKVRNKNKIIKRREVALHQMGELLTTTKEDLETAEEKISGLKDDQKRLNQRIIYWKEKASAIANADSDEPIEELIHY